VATATECSQILRSEALICWSFDSKVLRAVVSRMNWRSRMVPTRVTAPSTFVMGSRVPRSALLARRRSCAASTGSFSIRVAALLGSTSGLRSISRHLAATAGMDGRTSLSSAIRLVTICSIWTASLSPGEPV